ncbi:MULTISPECIES: hypothetical protein [unclassified Variovorax]|uniref:hypothetical protein n=1 Tax=unclassified Variovorax TaxID=663243 RepID=UPI000A845961|nr:MULTISPECIES: hypothetical protein [unclassified Variovorax]PNG46985.1 hypothetical protein CHC06_07328 [Variovorax sp. B2]PNG48364.1 hypothetical protein CHC07_07540 [Variovorax sp. B4]VTV14834.1 hypothetical protein WDL1CHR_05302 [Variovorax sp. WDL1]
MTIPKSGDGVSLETLETLMMPVIISSEKDLKAVLAEIKSGKDVDAAQLLYYTNEVNQNNLTVNMCASMVKERGDTLKTATQKFG